MAFSSKSSLTEAHEGKKVVNLRLLHHPLLGGEHLRPQLPAQMLLVDLIVDISFCFRHQDSAHLARM